MNKRLIFLIFCNTLLLNLIAQFDTLELSKSQQQSCYNYFVRDYLIDSEYTGIDTIDCYWLDEQIKIIRYCKNGHLELYKAYYQNGTLYKTQEFLNGKRNGIGTVFYKNGNKQEFYKYVNGNRITYINWFENGLIKVIQEGVHQRNEDNYRRIEFDSLQNLVSYEYRLDTESSAFYAEKYYPQMIIKSKTMYNAGVQPYISYYLNGKKQMEGDIHTSEYLHIGKWHEWHENGTLKCEFYYSDVMANIRTGEWKWWDNEGNLEKIQIYENDVLINEEIYK